MPPNTREIVVFLVVSLGLERALRLVRMHRRTRLLVLGSWAGFNALNAFGTNRLTVYRQVLHDLTAPRLERVYMFLIGLYFMYQLEAAPTMSFHDRLTQRALNHGYWLNHWRDNQ